MPNSRFALHGIKNLLMPLFLMGCFPGDFQEGKRPIKAFRERPIKVGKRPIKEGKRPHYFASLSIHGLNFTVYVPSVLRMFSRVITECLP